MTAIKQSDIQYFGTAAAGMLDGNSSKETRIQSAYALAERGLRMFFGACAEAAQASADVEASQKKNNDLETATKTQADANKKAFDDKVEEIRQNQEKIKEILEKITDFEDEKEDINAEVKAHEEEINRQVANYENATNNEDRKKALEAISAENASVRELLDRVKVLGAEQEKLNEMGEEFKTKNGDLEAQSADIKQDGEAKMNALNAQATANRTEATTLAAREGEYTTRGVRLLTEAAALEAGSQVAGFISLGLGSAVGSAEANKLRMQAQDCFSAANVIGTGVPNVFLAIGSAVDGVGTNLGYLSNTSSLVGSLSAAANGDVQTFSVISNAVGSWLNGAEDWNNTNQEVTAAVTTGEEEIESDNKK